MPPKPKAKKVDPPVRRVSSSRLGSGTSKESSRNRFPQGRHTLPCRESELTGNLSFNTKLETDRYVDICTRDIIACKYIDHPTLEKLNIHKEVSHYIENIGWEKFCAMNCPVFIELVREFYTTFVFQSDLVPLDEPDVI